MLVSRAAAGMGDVSLWNCLNPLDPNCAVAVAQRFAPMPTVGVPPVPSPAMLASPWTGTVDQEQTAMVTQALRNQQALDAFGVDTTAGSVIGGDIYNVGQAVAPALPWVGLALLGIGILALIILVKG